MTGAAAAGITVALLTVLLVAVPVRATPRLTLESAATFGEPVTLTLTARNDGDEPAAGVHPETVFAHQTRSGERVGLEPGASHTWRFDLPAPRSPGTYPARVNLRYADGRGEEREQPFVALIRTPAAPASPLDVRLEAGPVAGAGTVRLSISNATDIPAAGRVVAVLPDALHTAPESQPVQVPAGTERVVPFVVQNRDAAPRETYPVYAWFEYTLEGTHYTAVAEASLRTTAEHAGHSVPLLVGGVLTAAAIGAVVLAVRRSRPQR
jgi:uncharacterized protein (DUF58 family)